MEDYVTGTGQQIQVHDHVACTGQHCVIHNPSGHSMRSFPTHWRSDRYLMERICPHGIGHPDPDDIEFKRHAMGPHPWTDEQIRTEVVHGCDGCCDGVDYGYRRGR